MTPTRMIWFGVGELFGSANVDGYDELQTIDANADGRIDALDPAFANLKVWRDFNSDGASTSDEILTLSQAGITRFNLAYTQTDTAVSGNLIARTGSYGRTDGTTRAMASVQFELDESGNLPVIPEGADLGSLPVLPNLPGLLALSDLHTAMHFDPALKAQVEDLVFGDKDFDTFAEFRDGGFLDVIYRWAGVDTSVPLESGDQPYYIQALSAFMGSPFDELNSHQVERLSEFWPEFVKQLGLSFLFQAAQNPALHPFYAIAQDVAELDPNSPTYLDDLNALAATADGRDSLPPAYEYLELFTGLTTDSETGELSGDFNAFVSQFISDQPSFSTTFSGVGGGGGSGRIVMPSGSGGSGSTSAHAWTAWYEDQGSLLFHVANAMGIGPEYVLNVTGWRWLTGEATDLDGTDGNDIMDQAVTYFTRADGAVIPTHDQRMFGYEGDDELRGNDGVDRLVGGPGNDLLLGGSGSDMYIYASGDGLDRITDASGAEDAIFFSGEFNRADLRVSRPVGTNDLLLHFGDPTQGITLTNQWGSAASAVEQFHFVAEDGLNSNDIASLYLASLATEAGDYIAGGWAWERLIGLGGNDNLWGGPGHDTLDGGAGDDHLNGHEDNDLLLGGAGNDELWGLNGNDTLDGGSGNDILIGELGNDTYVFGRGYGQDIVRDYNGNFAPGSETILLASDIAPTDLIVTQANVGWDIVLSIAGTTDTLTLDDTILESDRRIEQVQFADGTIWSHAELMTRATAPTAGNDTFYGSYDSETLDGGAGNDILDARAGNDTLLGRSGNDILIGGEGNDTYVFARGDGQDIIRDYNGNFSPGSDTILLGSDIAPTEVIVTQADGGRDIILSVAGTTDSITLDDTIVESDRRIEQVQFANGTVWSHAELMARATAPTPGNDIFYGSYDAETLSGGGGNDTLNGLAGDDTLIGGTGNDILIGSTGNDVHVFELGDGQDIIREAGSPADYDRIDFGSGIAPSNVIVSYGGDNSHLVLSIVGTSDSVTIERTVSDGAYRIDRVRFADGTNWYHADLVALANAGDNTFYGSNGADVISSGAGNDSIDARGGNDLLTGGTGNDILTGSTGNDVYVFDLGDGQDIIREAGSNGDYDRIDFGSGIAPGDVIVSYGADSRHLVLSVVGTTDSITIERTMSDYTYRIDRIRFADGTNWYHPDLVARADAQAAGGSSPASSMLAAEAAFMEGHPPGMHSDAAATWMTLSSQLIVPQPLI